MGANPTQQLSLRFVASGYGIVELEHRRRVKVSTHRILNIVVYSGARRVPIDSCGNVLSKGREAHANMQSAVNLRHLCGRQPAKSLDQSFLIDGPDLIQKHYRD